MKKSDCPCEYSMLNPEIIQQLEENMPSEEMVQRLVMFFKAISHDTRIKIISALRISETCVCDLACVLEMTQSAVSHQLKILREQGLVKYRREGKECYYSLTDNHVLHIYEQALTHMSEELESSQDDDCQR